MRLRCKEMFGGCPRKAAGAKSGQRMELCPAVHAERRALLWSARFGESTEDTVLYCWCGIPCKDCMAELIEAGVRKIVCLDDNKFERKQPTAYNFGLSARLATEAKIEIIMVKTSGKEKL
jgi:deoxycytidylate deaminase